MKKWYAIAKGNAQDAQTVNADSSKDVTRITISDTIGAYGVSARDFLNELEKVQTKDILIILHSPGGEVMDGFAIYNALRAHTSFVTTQIIGYAASMASIVFLAGDRRLMSENSYAMIHRPTTFGMNADELKAELEQMKVWFASLVPQVESDVDLLRSLENTFLNMYTSASNWDEGTARKKMNATTWLTANEMANAGFISKEDITDTVKVAATATDIEKLNLLGFKAPKNLLAMITQGEESGTVLNNKILNYMAKKLTSQQVGEALADALTKHGFTMSGDSKLGEKKLSQNLNAMLTDIVNALDSGGTTTPKMKTVTAFLDGKKVKVQIPVNEATETEETEETEGEETEETEGEETEGEETEETEGEDKGKKKPNAKKPSASDNVVMKELSNLKAMVAKMATKPTNGGGGEQESEFNPMDIINGKHLKANANKGQGQTIDMAKLTKGITAKFQKHFGGN